MNEEEKKKTLQQPSEEAPKTNSEGAEAGAEEVNTFDAPPLFAKRAGAKKARAGQSRFFPSLSSFLAICLLLLTVLFSASDFLRVLLSDSNLQDTLTKKIFGKSSSGQSESYLSMILHQIFLEIPGASSSKGTESSVPSALPPKPTSAPPKPSEASPSQTLTPSASPQGSPLFPSPTASPDLHPGVKRYPILPVDMSLLSHGKNFIYNDTKLSPDIAALSARRLAWDYQSDVPLVLILHTHGSEAFMPEGASDYADEGEIARSYKSEENMIAVGRVFAQTLQARGIGVIHCEIAHDTESYRESYARSAETIRRYLEAYPTIRYVLDLHRDSLMQADGGLIRAVTSVDGDSCAQVMAVVGSGFDGWEDNMVLALQLREKLNGTYKHLGRPVCLRTSLYNQNLAPHALLLEIGTSGNSLSEAKKAAVLTAEALADIIKGI